MFQFHLPRSKNPIGFRVVDRPLLLISSFNKLVPGATFRGRSKPPIGSVEFLSDPIVVLNLLGGRILTSTITYIYTTGGIITNLFVTCE
jgi:hypothetical protein